MSFDDNSHSAKEFGELRSDVRHIQSDVADIRADVRIMAQRIDAVRTELTTRIEAVRTELTKKIDAIYDDLGKVKDSIASAKIWALTLYVGLAGSLFYALARGFKWI